MEGCEFGCPVDRGIAGSPSRPGQDLDELSRPSISRFRQLDEEGRRSGCVGGLLSGIEGSSSDLKSTGHPASARRRSRRPQPLAMFDSSARRSEEHVLPRNSGMFEGTGCVGRRSAPSFTVAPPVLGGLPPLVVLRAAARRSPRRRPAVSASPPTISLRASSVPSGAPAWLPGAALLIAGEAAEAVSPATSSTRPGEVGTSVGAHACRRPTRPARRSFRRGRRPEARRGDPLRRNVRRPRLAKTCARRKRGLQRRWQRP